MNINDLLVKATKGPLTKAERDFAANVAKSGTTDAYTATIVLGRALAKEHREIVEGLLYSPTNPMLARGALYAICDCWGEAERYLTEIVSFCRKVPWDEDDDVRLLALSCGGEYLRAHWDETLAESLLRVAEDDSDDIVQNAARTAIARAMGLEHDQIPTPRRLLDQGSSALVGVVERFRKRLNGNDS